MRSFRFEIFWNQQSETEAKPEKTSEWQKSHPCSGELPTLRKSHLIHQAVFRAHIENMTEYLEICSSVWCNLSLSARFWLLINDFHMCSAPIRKLSHQKGEFINQVLGGDPENANCKLRRRVNSGISEQPSFDPVAGAGDLEPEQHCAHYSK